MMGQTIKQNIIVIFLNIGMKLVDLDWAVGGVREETLPPHTSPRTMHETGLEIIAFSLKRKSPWGATIVVKIWHSNDHCSIDSIHR